MSNLERYVRWFTLIVGTPCVMILVITDHIYYAVALVSMVIFATAMDLPEVDWDYFDQQDCDNRGEP